MQCTAETACANGIDCASVGDCDVRCSGANSCMGTIACTDTQCIDCSSNSACSGGTCNHDMAACMFPR